MTTPERILVIATHRSQYMMWLREQEDPQRFFYVTGLHDLMGWSRDTQVYMLTPLRGAMSGKDWQLRSEASGRFELVERIPDPLWQGSPDDNS